MLQTDDGMLWFATWNGLDRFDGYEFVNFKAQAGNGIDMPNDRLRDIRLAPNGDICCRADDEWFLFSRSDGHFYSPQGLKELFTDTSTGRGAQGITNKSVTYRDRNGYLWLLDQQGNLAYCKDDTTRWIPYPTDTPLGGVRAYMSDSQGNLWFIMQEGICCLSFDQLTAQPLSQAVASQVRCTFVDNLQRYWVATRDDASLSLFDRDNRFLGYLTPQGRLSQRYVSFGSPVYCMLQLADGTYLLGSKPDGLLRLKEVSLGVFSVERLKGVLPCDNVYDMKQDSHGRIWAATLGGGVVMLGSFPFGERLAVDRQDSVLAGSKVRFIHITDDDIMLAATTEGLLVGRLPSDGTMPLLRLHQREASRVGSLGCNATMDVLETSDHRLFVSTESGGISEIMSSDLTAPQLEFRHFNRHNGLGSDVVLSLAEIDGQVFAVSNHQLLTLSLDSADGGMGFYDQGFFHQRYRFSEMHPVRLPDGRWLFGLLDGAIAMSPDKMVKSRETFPLVLTGIDRHRQEQEYVSTEQDTILLLPGERELTLRFATLDYRNPSSISYAFRLEGEPDWNYIGHGHTTSLTSLKPGTYRLQLRSTNADGVWVENIRTLTIIVKPTFWRAWYGQLLIILAVALLLGAAVYTYLYIKRMHKQQERLRAYLSLIEAKVQGVAQPSVSPTSEKSGRGMLSSFGNATGEFSPPLVGEPCLGIESEEVAFMNRVVRYVEEHIADADANIDGMADAVATSRSVLFRKMKSIVGLTPADFLREARIKRACLLLTNTQKPVSDVAYSCGFSDPKYFSKCFKASTGSSPTEYRRVKEG